MARFNSSSCQTIPLVPFPDIKFHIYIFIFLFMFGVAGNIMNLVILNSKSMRNRTNILLSCMAACDLLLLCARIPATFASFDSFAFSNNFRSFYYAVKQPLLALANWFSAASIWFALAVTIERAMAIHSPLKASPITWKTSRFRQIIILIFLTSYLITFYYNVWFIRIPWDGCENRTDIIVYRFKPATQLEDTPQLIRHYLNISPILSSIFIIFLPLIAMISLDAILICHLKRHRQAIERIGSRSSKESSESRVTMVVCVIIGSFILFNIPSSVLHCLFFWKPELWRYKSHKIVVEISNSLIVMGKVINFILYCMSSRHFRKKAWFVLKEGRLTRLAESRIQLLRSPNPDPDYESIIPQCLVTTV